MNIKVIDKTQKYLVASYETSEADVYNAIESIVGDKTAPNGIPYAIEVSSWADLAIIGEKYVTDEFEAICVGDIEI